MVNWQKMLAGISVVNVPSRTQSMEDDETPTAKDAGSSAPHLVGASFGVTTRLEIKLACRLSARKKLKLCEL